MSDYLKQRKSKRLHRVLDPILWTLATILLLAEIYIMLLMA